MRQHGVTEEEAKQELWKQVDDAWKDMNEELLRPTAVPFPLVNEILNVVHLIDLVYKEDDIYTHSDTEMKDIINFPFGQSSSHIRVDIVRFRSYRGRDRPVWTSPKP